MTQPEAHPLQEVADNMSALSKVLDALPDDTQWSSEALDALDAVRHAALRLADTAEAIISDLGGTS